MKSLRKAIFASLLALGICQAHAEDGVTDRPAAFWAEAMRLRDLLKFEFFFADKETFRDELRREMARLVGYGDFAALSLDEGQTAQIFYLVRAVSPGTFLVPPPLVEDMYRPQIRGVGRSEPPRIEVGAPAKSP